MDARQALRFGLLIAAALCSDAAWSQTPPAPTPPTPASPAARFLLTMMRNDVTLEQYMKSANDRFPQLAAQSLVPGGVIYLRTDDADYFSQIKTVFDGCPLFSGIPTPEDLAVVVTDFEREFLKRGIQTLRAAYQLAPP